MKEKNDNKGGESMVNILITGGAGYLGTALCDVLDEDPGVGKITVYDALIRGDRRFLLRQKPYRKVRFVQGDILETEKLEKACRGHDVVVHLAAFVDEPYHQVQHLQYDQTNGYGSLSVVRAVESLPEVRRAICVSSSAVYGFRDGIRWTDAPAPSNGYGQSKWLGERYFEQLASAGKQVDVLRCAQIFGANRAMRFDTVIHAFLLEALTGGRVDVFGDGRQMRAFVDIDQVVRVIRGRALDGVTKGGVSTEFVAAFQSSVAALLNWLTDQIPSTEYRYLTPNVTLPGQGFEGLGGLDLALMNQALVDFEAMLSIRTALKSGRV